MASGWRKAAAGTRGGVGRLAAMVGALAAGLLLTLAAEARGESLVTPVGLAVADGAGWHSDPRFHLAWSTPDWEQPYVDGAGWRLTGPGFDGGLQFAPGTGLSSIDVIVPGGGEYRLAVWLDLGGKGFEAEAATTALRFDGAPPIVALQPFPAGEIPPFVVASVSDSLSGVERGAISYRRADVPVWHALPAELRQSATGSLALVAAAPDLAPGVEYVIRAEARDGAGNVATTSMRADGLPAVLGTPPGEAGPSAPRQGHRGAPTRLIATLRRGSLRSRRLLVDFGAPAVLVGRLLGPGRNGLAERPLRVVVEAAAGGGRRVEHLLSDRDGSFELRLAAGPSRRFTVVFPGAAGLAPSRRGLRLSVRAGITLRAQPTSLRTGGVVRLSGRVRRAGARISRPGKLVTISYFERASRRWRPVILTRTDRAGRFQASYRFRYVSGRALIRLRAAAPAEARWPYAPGFSRPVTLEVTG